MSGIVTWAQDPRAKTIPVYYTESSTIYEGMPVCYEFDATTNWTGVDGSVIDFTTTASTAGLESTTTAESYANEGKYIRVEDPDADNLGNFAGVVAGAEKAGQTGPCALDIYIPNGAVVPVRADCECTVGRTVLCVNNGDSACNTNGRPIAVAQETDAALDTTAGTILAKLDPNMFMWQRGDAAALIYDDDESTTTSIMNHIYVTSAHTGGSFVPLMVQGAHTGNTAASCNPYAILAYNSLDGTYDQTVYARTILGQTNISGTVNGSNVHIAGVCGQLSGTPTFTECSHACALWGDSALTVAPTTGNLEILRLTNNGAARMDQMVYMYGNSGASSGGADYIWYFDGLYFGGAVNTPIRDGGTGDTTIDTGGDWKKIRVNIGGTAYWLVAMTNPSET